MAEYERVHHTFEPIYNEQSRILILGSFPSVKSREYGFYYGHPRNRFWKVIAAVFECNVPETLHEKKQMLFQNEIALWDVIESCDIIGSSDNTIKNVQPANISRILESGNIQKIIANGKVAKRLYDKYMKEKTGIEILELPSTSPANAIYSLERLIDTWTVIK